MLSTEVLKVCRVYGPTELLHKMCLERSETKENSMTGIFCLLSLIMQLSDCSYQLRVEDQLTVVAITLQPSAFSHLLAAVATSLQE